MNRPMAALLAGGQAAKITLNHFHNHFPGFSWPWFFMPAQKAVFISETYITLRA